MKNPLLLAPAILLATLLSGFDVQASDEATAVEETVEVNELSKTETPDTQPSRPEVAKVGGDSQAIEVGDDIEISGALSIDDEGIPTADDDIKQLMQEAISFLDGLWRIWNAISTPVIILFGYVLPAFFILRDSRVKLSERALWLLATFAVSWLAFLVFLWIAPLFGSPSEYEDEESSTFKTSRNVLTGGTSIAAGIAFGAGALLVMFAFLIADASQGFAFFAGIPLFAGMALMIPGVVLAVALAIGGSRKSIETIVGPRKQGVAPAVITLAVGVLAMVIPMSFRSYRNGPLLSLFIEIAAIIGLLMAVFALGYLLIQLISAALKRRRQQR
ncbi:MAG: hypothetical protein IH910_09795 [Proteobacteria bacterium]|nr:hypothetical protein [Pseudomonadota bacterium]